MLWRLVILCQKRHPQSFSVSHSLCGDNRTNNLQLYPLTHVIQRVKNGWDYLNKYSNDGHQEREQDSWTAASIDP